jgi:hypothetical protein
MTYIEGRGSGNYVESDGRFPHTPDRGYNALCSVLGLELEVRYANQERTPRIRLLSRLAASVAKDSRRRLMSNGAIASWAAAKS